MLNIIPIPNYIYNTLMYRGINLDKIEDIINNIDLNINHKYNIKDSTNIVNADSKELLKPITCITKSLSKNDIKDIIMANKLIIDMLGIETCNKLVKYITAHDEDTSYYRLTTTSDNINSNYIEFINILGDNDINATTDFIMNNKDPGYNAPFFIRATDHCLFIILEQGFTNFKLVNDLCTLYNFRKILLGILLNFIAKRYGVNIIPNSNSILKEYISTLYSLKNM